MLFNLYILWFIKNFFLVFGLHVCLSVPKWLVKNKINYWELSWKATKAKEKFLFIVSTRTTEIFLNSSEILERYIDHILMQNGGVRKNVRQSTWKEIWLPLLEPFRPQSHLLHGGFWIPFWKYEKCYHPYTGHSAGICSFGLWFWVENFRLPTFFRLVTHNMISCVKRLFLNRLFLCWLLQIRPLVKPTRIIVDMDPITYSWHDLVSKSKPPHHIFYDTQILLWSIYFVNMLKIVFSVISLWVCYLLNARGLSGLPY